MKNPIRSSTLIALLAVTMTPCLGRAADSAERAAVTKEKIQAFRAEIVKVRRQIIVTTEELKRLNTKGVELRPQFEKFKAELVKMEEEAKVALEDQLGNPRRREEQGDRDHRQHIEGADRDRPVADGREGLGRGAEASKAPGLRRPLRFPLRHG